MNSVFWVIEGKKGFGGGWSALSAPVDLGR